MAKFTIHVREREVSPKCFSVLLAKSLVTKLIPSVVFSGKIWGSNFWSSPVKKKVPLLLT